MYTIKTELKFLELDSKRGLVRAKQMSKLDMLFA